MVIILHWFNLVSKCFYANTLQFPLCLTKFPSQLHSMGKMLRMISLRKHRNNSSVKSYSSGCRWQHHCELSRLWHCSALFLCFCLHLFHFFQLFISTSYFTVILTTVCGLWCFVFTSVINTWLFFCCCCCSMAAVQLVLKSPLPKHLEMEIQDNLLVY